MSQTHDRHSSASQIRRGPSRLNRAGDTISSEQTDTGEPFSPKPNDPLMIRGSVYYFAPHPRFPRRALGMGASRGTVYQVVTRGNQSAYALKVFKELYRDQRYAHHPEIWEGLSKIPGLRVCDRIVLNLNDDAGLLHHHPDLAYTILMPWVADEIWQAMVHCKTQITAEISCTLAQSLARVLAELERRGVAHCDMAGRNVAIIQQKWRVELIDVEDLYAPGLSQPSPVSAKSPGYAHCTPHDEMWNPEADRFAGAVVLAEMLGWCDPDVRNQAYGETYFDPKEMQQPCKRFNVIRGALADHWGKEIAQAFEEAWYSRTLDKCPSLDQWKHLVVAAIHQPTVRLPVEVAQPMQPTRPLPAASVPSITIPSVKPPVQPAPSVQRSQSAPEPSRAPTVSHTPSDRRLPPRRQTSANSRPTHPRLQPPTRHQMAAFPSAVAIFIVAIALLIVLGLAVRFLA